jgi:hypothetical protein
MLQNFAVQTQPLGKELVAIIKDITDDWTPCLPHCINVYDMLCERLLKRWAWMAAGSSRGRTPPFSQVHCSSLLSAHTVGLPMEWQGLYSQLHRMSTFWKPPMLTPERYEMDCSVIPKKDLPCGPCMRQEKWMWKTKS